jgi:hypothetical protein
LPPAGGNNTLFPNLEGRLPTPIITAYLAGPVSNCNPKQRTEWRKQMKLGLKKLGHKFIDPAEHIDNWTPLMELVEIEKCDLVIANIWRESIGTALGIFQARRLGKPVILIDPNYIDSKILREIVGSSFVVHSVEKALNKLENELVPEINHAIQVLKKNGREEAFSPSKLQRSLNIVCSDAKVNDAVLPVLVASRVHTSLKMGGAGRVVETHEIRKLVLDHLEQISRQPDKLYAEDLAEHARHLIEEWRIQEGRKDEKRAFEELSQESLTRETAFQKAVDENRQLRAELKKNKDAAPLVTFGSVTDAVKAASERFVGRLIFSEKAFSSSQDCPYLRPEEVYEALDALAQYAQVKKDQTERVPGLKEWLKQKGIPFEYASGESETTRSSREAQRERSVILNGKSIPLFRHLKLGSGNPNTCCRIYFVFLGPEHAHSILIGHVGRHLSTAST